MCIPVHSLWKAKLAASGAGIARGGPEIEDALQRMHEGELSPVRRSASRRPHLSVLRVRSTMK